jgi:hypothetical protein
MEPKQIKERKKTRKAIVAKIHEEFPGVPVDDWVRELLLLTAEAEVFEGIAPHRHELAIPLTAGRVIQPSEMRQYVNRYQKFYLKLLDELVQERRFEVERQVVMSRIGMLEKAAEDSALAMQTIRQIMQEGSKDKDRLEAAKEIRRIVLDHQPAARRDDEPDSALNELGKKVSQVLELVGGGRQIQAEDAEVVGGDEA